jgi:hypothetical protein
MPAKNFAIAILSVALVAAIIVIGFMSSNRSPVAVTDAADQAPNSSEHTFNFDSSVDSYGYSEKNIVGLKKIDDQTYRINSLNPGMCVISFTTTKDRDVPAHARKNTYIISVDANKEITIQRTVLWSGGML